MNSDNVKKIEILVKLQSKHLHQEPEEAQTIEHPSTSHQAESTSTSSVGESSSQSSESESACSSSQAKRRRIFDCENPKT